jgi:hypothetical protein
MILPLLLASVLQGAPAAQEATKPAAAPASEHPAPCDPKDGQPLLLGACSREEILAHRAVFKDHMAEAQISPELRRRWMAVKQPLTLVVAFGSWCGDSQREVPDFLALDSEHSSFVDVRFIGVARDKAIAADAWPAGFPVQKAERVPTFWLFSLQPGGAEKLVGSVVEHPAKDGEKMSEAVVELIESAK